MMVPTNDPDINLLAKTKLFHGLTETQLRAVQQHATACEVARRSFFFHQGEPATTFYLIRQGQVRLSQINPEGKQVIIHLFGPGDVIAVIMVLSNATYPLSAEAITDCEAWAWSGDGSSKDCWKLAASSFIFTIWQSCSPSPTIYGRYPQTFSVTTKAAKLALSPKIFYDPSIHRH